MAIEKNVYGYMKWWDVAEQPESFSDVPPAFKQSYDLWHQNADENLQQIIELLQPYIKGYFLPENIMDFDEIIEVDGFPEYENNEIRLVGVDFDGQEPLPKVKSEALFKVPFVDNIDEIDLDEWLEDHGGSFADCISFHWVLAENDDDDQLDLSFGDNQGTEAFITDLTHFE